LDEFFRIPTPNVLRKMAQLPHLEWCSGRNRSARASVTSHDYPHADEGCQWEIDDTERHGAGKTTPESDLYKRCRDARMDERKYVAAGGVVAGGIGCLFRADGCRPLAGGGRASASASASCGHNDSPSDLWTC
jgi:hypothetical protein